MISMCIRNPESTTLNRDAPQINQLPQDLEGGRNYRTMSANTAPNADNLTSSFRNFFNQQSAQSDLNLYFPGLAGMSMGAGVALLANFDFGEHSLIAGASWALLSVGLGGVIGNEWFARSTDSPDSTALHRAFTVTITSCGTAIVVSAICALVRYVGATE